MYEDPEFHTTYQVTVVSKAWAALLLWLMSSEQVKTITNNVFIMKTGVSVLTRGLV